MAHSDHFLPLYDAKGNLYAVLLSADLWTSAERRLRPLIEIALQELEPQPPVETPEPLGQWEEFKQWWDFKYPYCADVVCRNCGARTDNWLADPAHPFRLKSAQLGGLAVFSCKACGATVRKKHFKDHYCFEVTVDHCGCG